MAENSNKDEVVQVGAADLPLHCPQPDAPLWARHPRVFLDVLKSGEAVCPYCSARYVFTGERPKGHH
ncbi:zinc-finger domain-containing protein [Pseudothauera lacus]|uniref:Zinc-finger domain-containing protein n=1 Tax=Pseudothauera lacus TaxID=2136175 RepID=A0A2T4IEH3_9RHOO|nr:zinc-finger domain-containing protein [Pseudothauera lacus]PTD96170.1 zinc-finger domain-containing protein [Pseudothauera lacus]